jgi:hypothetical protein
VIFECIRRVRHVRHSGPAALRAATIEGLAQNAHGSRREGWPAEQDRQIGRSAA